MRHVGISFTRSGADDQLFASVAQVFNELGDGVVVRGAVAEESAVDLPPHVMADPSLIERGEIGRV